jgi:cytidylate kinase
MSVITIRGQLGSGAPEIGKLVAGRLCFDYVDREIIDEVASRTNYHADTIAEKEMPATTLAGRIIEALNKAYPAGVAREGAYVPGWEFPLEDKEYLEALQMVIKELAENGSIVIRGRGSQFILKGFPGTFHVLTVASMETRVKRVMENRQIDSTTARKEIDQFDSSRKQFIKRYFKADIEDPVNYDLVINTESLSSDDAAVLIIKAMIPKDQANTC